MQLSEGIEPFKGVVWIKTHTKNGTAVDEELENIALQRSQGEGVGSVPFNEDFKNYFGPEKHGYVQTYGLGVAPSKVGQNGKNGVSKNISEGEEPKLEVENLQSELDKVNIELRKVNCKYATLEEQMGRVIALLPPHLHQLVTETVGQVSRSSTSHSDAS